MSTPLEVSQIDEEISSKHIAEIMLEYGLKKGYKEWKEAKSAVIAAEPSLKDIEYNRLNRAWRTATEWFDKTQNNNSNKNGDENNKINENNDENDESSKVVTPVEQVVEGVNPFTATQDPTKPSPQVVIINNPAVNQGVGSAMTVVTPTKQLVRSNKQVVKSNKKVVETPKEPFKLTPVVAKKLDVFVRTLLDEGISYEKLVEAVRKYKGESLAVVVESVKVVILDMYEHLIPVNLVKETLKEQFHSSFDLFVTATAALKDANGALPKGWEKLNLNTNPGSGTVNQGVGSS